MASEGFLQDQLLRDLQLTAGRIPSFDAFRAQRGQLLSACPSSDRLEEPLKQTNWSDFAHILIRGEHCTLCAYGTDCLVATFILGIQNELTNNEMDQFLSSRLPRSGNLRRMNPGIGSTFNLIISKPSTASEVAAIIDLSSHQSSPTQ
ncbi:hypothetical protein PTTG_28583 [Puccinia triticina 1-1 BBBD Race 1]|uniref:Uncharacterized protein n=1 Tax=Puccinia triticina (isolate 1-1 / race 1 (BBBD)) TaxID=630390 RepID=A0A180GBL3_PUCT1|nr:hypothetical protein PTTG_28583 [Puccinia triticina 1-1 BBBD Race 1]